MSLLSLRLRAAVLVVALLPLCVSASESGLEPDTSQGEALRPGRQETRLDMGLAAGVRAPSGAFGVELEFRPIKWLGLQLGGGTDVWGYRLSPLLRVYPLGRGSFSPFLEAGASFNLGHEATVGGDGASQPVELLFTPVAIVGLGVRGDLGAHAFISPRVGWGKRLRQDNIRATGGRLLDASGELMNTPEQQQGLLFGLSVGVSFL